MNWYVYILMYQSAGKMFNNNMSKNAIEARSCYLDRPSDTLH